MEPLPQNAAMVRAVQAETEVRVAEGWKVANELYAVIQKNSLTNLGRADLDRRFAAAMDALERHIAQLRNLQPIVDALNGGNPGPA